MTKEEDDALFPPAWGWQSYESAFREAAEREALIRESEMCHGSGIQAEIQTRWLDYERTKFLHWWDDQVFKGRLPTDDVLVRMEDAHGRHLEAILDRAIADARLRLRGVQKTLTFFGQRPDLSNDHNPPVGSLSPENDNERNGPVPPSPTPAGPVPAFPCKSRDTDRRHRR